MPRTAAKPATAFDVETFGVPPPKATHWTAHRLTPNADGNGSGTPLSFQGGRGLNLREWPIAELTLENLRRRWGPGRYRIGWIAATKSGRREAMGRGKNVELADLAEVEEEETHTAELVKPTGFERETQYLETVNKQAAGQLGAVVELTKLFMAQSERRDELEMKRQADRDQRERDNQIALALNGIGQQLSQQNERLARLEQSPAAVVETEEEEEEEEEEESDEGGPFSGDRPIMDQLGTILANGTANAIPKIGKAIFEILDQKEKAETEAVRLRAALAEKEAAIARLEATRANGRGRRLPKETPPPATDDAPPGTDPN